MPELPEVETIRAGLAPRVEGRRIERVAIHEGAERLARHRERAPASEYAPQARRLEEQLTGRRVEGLGRHGKHLIARLDDGRAWVLHLGMTGLLLYRPSDAARARFERARVDLDGGNGLRFEDMRNFGRWAVAADPREVFPNLGPDALSDGFTADWLHGALARRGSPVKTALLDQRVAAGVGNLYADEALWLARIAPWTPSNGLGAERAGRLRDAVLRALREGVEAGGNSFEEQPNGYRYVDAFGKDGSHHGREHVFLREDKPCRRSGCGGRVALTRIGGRRTFYCPACQTTPGGGGQPPPPAPRRPRPSGGATRRGQGAEAARREGARGGVAPGKREGWIASKRRAAAGRSEAPGTAYGSRWTAEERAALRALLATHGPAEAARRFAEAHPHRTEAAARYQIGRHLQ